jgi:hypothetical protein
MPALPRASFVQTEPEKTSLFRSLAVIQKLEGAMEHTSPLPVMIALMVAIIGSIVLYRMDFARAHSVRNDGINKITRAALARAGATATPTQPNE